MSNVIIVLEELISNKKKLEKSLNYFEIVNLLKIELFSVLVDKI